MQRRSFLILLPALAGGQGVTPGRDYAAMAARIAAALKLRRGERVLMRFDPSYFAELVPLLERQIQEAGAKVLAPLRAADPLGSRVLEPADVYLWLPLGKSARPLGEVERDALSSWLEKGATRRELHFHWAEGTRPPDGLPAEHPPEFDALYQGALQIDYAALNTAQDRATETLLLGTVRVQTSVGTDVMFRIGERPFNKQNGDASPERARAARVRVDREIELPAGALRVAPVEDSVSGGIVLPEARFGDAVAAKVVLQIDSGRITRIRAEKGQEAVEAELAAGGEAARWFGSFALGFNPKLVAAPGSTVVPYYGYGAGAVRLSLGDNRELGGEVRGSYMRWFFFTDATVHVDFRYLVRNGVLQTLETN